jgi:ferritin heavy chain
MQARARQNFHEESEAAINRQINIELHASYVYLAMSSFYDRDTVALPGLSKFFSAMSKEERDHACILIQYMAKRGGITKYSSIPAPPAYTSETKTLELLNASLEMEKAVNKSLLEMHAIADKYADVQMCDFIEQNFLDEQVESIKQLADLITQLETAGPEGLGLYLYDQRIGSIEPK